MIAKTWEIHAKHACFIIIWFDDNEKTLICHINEWITREMYEYLINYTLSVWKYDGESFEFDVMILS